MPTPSSKKKLDNRTTSALLSGAANLFSEALFLLDRSHRIILANNAAQKLTGLDESSLIGRQINSILTIQDPKTQQRVTELEIPKTELLVLQAKLDATSNTATFLPLSFIPDFAAFRPRATALAILSAPTSEDIQNSTSTLYLQILGQLTMRIAHDFGNYLTVIRGNAELLQEQISAVLQPNRSEESLDELLRQAVPEVEAIVRKSREMAHFVTTLQDYARQQPTTGESIDLNGAITDTIAMARHILGHKIQIEFLPSEDLPRVYIDRLHFDQILLSVLDHNKNAMPQGGRITIETDDIYLDELFLAAHPGSRSGNYIRLSITDTSAGMDPQTLNRIFDLPSSSITSDAALGLPTVYAVLKRFGGYIDVESWTGRGTRFDIFLPQTSPDSKIRASADVQLTDFPQDRSHNVLSRQRITVPTGALILIADDDSDIRDFIDRYVTRAGYETRIANEGNTALELYRTLTRERNQPALLIADLGLPGIDGRSLSHAIRQEYPGARILLTTGYRIEIDPSTKMTKDGFDFLQKPFAPNLLLTTIDRIIKPDR